jgi:hypothetical protein
MADHGRAYFFGRQSRQSATAVVALDGPGEKRLEIDEVVSWQIVPMDLFNCPQL